MNKETKIALSVAILMAAWAIAPRAYCNVFSERKVGNKFIAAIPLAKNRSNVIHMPVTPIQQATIPKAQNVGLIRLTCQKVKRLSIKIWKYIY